MKNKKINKAINNINILNQNKYTIFNQLDDNDELDKTVEIKKSVIIKNNNCDKKEKNIIDLVNNENFQQIVENISLENFGTKKLNTKWTLWFHHNPNDWQISGYKKIHTFETIDNYLQIMSYLHMITSIKNINLYLFRDNIEPTWEDKANSNGGCWSIKIPIDTGFNLWHKICNKAITENLLKQFSDRNEDNEDNDINGTINGISITNKSMNTIIKIWVSDRKVSNYQWLDADIINMINSKIMYQVISPEKH